MTKVELIDYLVTQFPDLYRKDLEETVTVIFDKISSTLSQDGRVELRGFGTFSTRQRKPVVGRNPSTGERIHIPARRLPHFKAGKPLREKINN